MNNLNLHQLLNSAEVYVNSILESLNSDTLPAEDCVSELKNILLRYKLFRRQQGKRLDNIIRTLQFSRRDKYAV
mgnify:CR=1 FL=1